MKSVNAKLPVRKAWEKAENTIPIRAGRSKKNTFAIVAEGDETELYFLNGEQIGKGDLDDHGSAGMVALTDLIERIAEVLGAVVTNEDPRA